MSEVRGPVHLDERPGETPPSTPEGSFASGFDSPGSDWILPPAAGSGGGGWGDATWGVTPPERPADSPRRRGLAVLAVVAMALGSGGVGAAIGASLHHRATTTTASATIPQPAASIPLPGGSAPAGASPGSSSNASSTLDPTAVAAKVDPGIVDINTTLTNGQAAGTGMVLTSSGLVLTNNHVIDGATSIHVQIDGTGPTYAASVIGYDITHDVALLQIQNVSGLKTIEVGDSSRVAVNDPVVAIGNALGRSGTPAVTEGQVSALDQTITASDGAGNSETLNGLIQINAPIQPGDSGGALANASGQVIGMNTAAAGGRRFATSNVAFAIPINSALSIARQIQAGQASSTIHIGARGVLGVEVQPSSLGAGSTSGAPVVGVASGSPAAAAGLTAGDVIVAVAGKAINSVDDLQPALAGYHPGDRVTISWLDGNGRRHDATLTLMTGPPA